jgi:NADH:ubiquinone oxidoreductase subunit C
MCQSCQKEELLKMMKMTPAGAKLNNKVVNAVIEHLYRSSCHLIGLDFQSHKNLILKDVDLLAELLTKGSKEQRIRVPCFFGNNDFAVQALKDRGVLTDSINDEILRQKYA